MKAALLSSLLLLLLLPLTTYAGTISPGLDALLSGMDGDDPIKVLVVLKDQADTKQLDQELYLRKATRAERHAAVLGGLKQVAELSQPDLLSTLEADRASGVVEGFTPYWIVNSVVVKTTVAHVRTLAKRADVERIEPNLIVENMQPNGAKSATSLPRNKAGVFTAPGLEAINVPQVWDELGIDGSGTIVANLDSGVDGNHPALADRWRGNNAPSAHCWQDHAQLGYPKFPVDAYGHGTHTMGTITGSTLFEKVGVAPGAQWIASNGTAAGTLEEFDNAVLEAFQWFADPDGDPATTDDVPDVIQNSWGVSRFSGLYPECYSIWWEVIDNCEAAGVVVLFSAGNEGPSPESLRSPGDRADTPTSCFSVGSTSTAPPYAISWFSSRGPSRCGGPYEMKPEVVAPGQDIISSIPGGGWGYLSGTSMAGPHVAGVVALMRQANPNVDVITIKEILMETARDLGVAGEDNTYGNGLIDAYQAVLTVLNEVGTLQGVVTDASTGTPLVGALLKVSSSQATTHSGADGAYRFGIRAGELTLTASLFGYDTTMLSVDVPAGGSLTQDIPLIALPSAVLSGVVRGPDGTPHAGATIEVLGQPVAPVLTDELGNYQFLLPAGNSVNYTLKATSQNLAYDLRQIGFQGATTLNFNLPWLRSDGFESASFNTFGYQMSGDLPWVISTDEFHEGIMSARPGAIAHGQTSVLSLDYYVNGAGEFSFWVMTESEVVYDRLAFSIDGVLQEQWSGQTEWTRFSTQLANGPHSFVWEYRKDGSVSILRDAIWIDEIQFPGTGVQPVAQISLPESFVRETIPVGGQTQRAVLVRSIGSSPLSYHAQLLDPETEMTPIWATVLQPDGTLYPGSEGTIQLDLDGIAAGSGVHRANLVIDSNDPHQPKEIVIVELVVGDATGAELVDRRLAGIRGVAPNPFNPRTEISFELPSSGTAELVIYSVSGRLVHTLVSGHLEAGEHRVLWNGRDDAGRDVASGVYLVQLRTAESTDVRRMALIR